MEHSRSDLRKLSAIVLTTGGWISGDLHLPAEQDACSFLDEERLLKMTDVLLEETGTLGQFYAVRTSAVALILAGDRSPGFQVPAPPADGRCVKVHLHVSAGDLQGEVDLPPGFRLTDFFQAADRWFVVRGCAVHSNFTPDPRPDGADRWPLALVNSAAVVGFTDDAVL
jgi:hypothetical protein